MISQHSFCVRPINNLVYHAKVLFTLVRIKQKSCLFIRRCACRMCFGLRQTLNLLSHWEKRIKTHAASRLAIFAASDTNGTAELNMPLLQPNVASLLPLKEMIRINPDSKQQEKVTVQTKRLDDVLASVGQEDTYNVMVLDIQGAELQALKGAVKTLAHVDAIVTEVNYGALYEGAGLIQMLDAFLLQHGFTRVDTMTTFSNLEGDALYLKKRFTEKITTPSA